MVVEAKNNEIKKLEEKKYVGRRSRFPLLKEAIFITNKIQIKKTFLMEGKTNASAE